VSSYSVGGACFDACENSLNFVFVYVYFYLWVDSQENGEFDREFCKIFGKAQR